MALGCSVLVVVYTAFAMHLSWIATIGHVGQIDHVERKKAPSWFWMLAVCYLGLAVPTACYLLSLYVHGGR